MRQYVNDSPKQSFSQADDPSGRYPGPFVPALPQQQRLPEQALVQRALPKYAAFALGSRSADSGSSGGRGQPEIARNTSRTKSPIAMSLKSGAWGDAGQYWFAAQNRNAAASSAAFAISARAAPCAI